MVSNCNEYSTIRHVCTFHTGTHFNDNYNITWRVYKEIGIFTCYLCFCRFSLWLFKLCYFISLSRMARVYNIIIYACITCVYILYIVDKITDNSELLHYYCFKCYFAIIQLPIVPTCFLMEILFSKMSS